MRVLITCECSGRVRDAFSALGHYAVSCDILPSETPGLHYQGNVFDIIGDEWDMIIGFPPCTHICVSGARYFKDKIEVQREAIAFFMALINADIPKICIENPVGIMSTVYRKPDQYIQPYQFGHDASKKTGLWLKGLSVLTIDPLQYVPPRIVDGKERWSNQCDSGQNKLGPSDTRAGERARTYPGIARAMALHWG